MVDPLTLSGVAWGISTAGWIISPIITKLVNKALSHIKPGKSKDELHELLTHTLPRLALTLEAAEGSAHMDLFEKLVRDLKSAFYDLEDMLDEVDYVLHQKQLIPQNRSKRIMFAWRDDAGSSDQGVNIKPSLIISGSLNGMLNKKIKKIKELIGEAQKTIELAKLPCHKGGGKNRPTATATYTQKPTTSDPEEKVIGRDKDYSQIKGMLRETEGGSNASSSGSKCFSVIGICGIPGSGKTALAQYVCDEGLKRCFAYCSIFPRRHYLPRDDLINMWMAEGFIKTTETEEEMEAIARDYVDELVSTSFLQKVGNMYPPCYLIHDLLHDLADKVAGRDCFRIENSWTGEVHLDVRHLFIETVDECAFINKIIKLEKLRTLIIRTGKNNIASEKIIEKIFTKLTNLRVLDMQSYMADSYKFSFPDYVGNLKHLRYLRFFNHGGLDVTLSGTIAKFYHLQVLSFSGREKLVLSSKKDMANLTNLRILRPVPDFPNIGRMTSLQELELFRVKKEQGYDLQQLKNLNKLQRSLCIEGLELVGSKEEALEAKLSDKERLGVLILAWGNNSSNCNLEVQADVLQGLCPPRFLRFLEIRNYQGLRPPDWTVDNMNGENHLQSLWLNCCSRLGPCPELVGYFVHLREIIITECNCDTLPNNIEHLESLTVLRIQHCLNILSLPALPQSLKRIEFWGCDQAFMRSCETSGDPNWLKIQHIPSVCFEGRQMGTGIIETQSLRWDQYVSL